MKLLKNFRLVSLLACIVLLLTGCWNRKEINDIGIVTATGLDLMPNKEIRLSVQIGIPAKLGSTAAGSGSSDIKNSTLVISETGETISDAYRNLQKKISRHIFFAHSRSLVIGEKLAKEGVAHIIDFFARYHEPRLHSYLILTKGEAVELLNSRTLLEKVPSEETRELVKQGIGLKITIKDFWDMMLADGLEPVAPQINITPREVGAMADAAADSDPKTQIIEGSAVFRKDKLVGWMDDMETRGILYLRNEISIGVITVSLPKEKGGGKVSVEIIKVESNITPNLGDGQLSIDVDIRSNVNVLESASAINLAQNDMILYLQSRLNKELKDRVELALKQAQQKYRSDILGLGRAVYRAYPKEWNRHYKDNWDDIFPDLKVAIHPNVVIGRIGLIKGTGG
ncbi:Ger(x)C family spore germination protein [Paenibacillus sp. GCM10023248]|nr:Ger(x)C family spore germination protein [Paenibacillus sp. MAHUQ-63]